MLLHLFNNAIMIFPICWHVGVRDDAVRPGTSTGAVKNLRNFLKAVSLGFGEEKPGNRHNYNKETAEHNIVVPPNVIKCDRVDERQNDQRAVDRDHFYCKTFGTERVWEDLGCVAEQEWRIADVVVEELKTMSVSWELDQGKPRLSLT